MRPFAFERPQDAEAAVALAAPAGAGAGTDLGEVAYLGGGTNLVDLMKLGVASPARVIDVSRLPYDRVEHGANGGLRIGGAVRNSDLAAHPDVRAMYPVVARATLNGASGQIRNRATVAGNLLQRTRCPYFQDTSKPCNKREPGSGCPAVEGANRGLAILGHSDACVATHPSDLAVALAACDAHVRVLGTDGSRLIDFTDFHRLPGDAPERDTVLEPAELITHVELAPLACARRSTYVKVRDRASFAFGLVSLAAAVDVAEDGTFADVRLALGQVAHKPWRCRVAEDLLRGSAPSEAAFVAAADAELAAARPLSDNGFKVPLARNLIVQTLKQLVGEER